MKKKIVSHQTDETATQVIDLGLLMKGESHHFSIPSILLRTDDEQLHQKV